MGLARTLVPPVLVVLVLLCALGSVDAVDAVDLRAEEEAAGSGEGNLTAEERFIPTRTPGYEGRREAAAESRRQQVTRTPPAAAFLLKLRVVDALSGRPLSAAAVDIYVNFTQTSSARTRDDGEVWFNIPRRARAVISALASKQRYVPALLPVTTDDTPVFSSVTLPLLGVNPGNMWLFDDSVLVTRKSTGMFGATPAVQFPRSALNLTQDDSLSAAAAFINSPSLWPAEGAPLHTMGIVSAKSGSVAVSLSPVASAFVQLVSSSSSSSSSDPVELNVSGPVSLSLSVSEGCGLQDGDHVPAWTLDHSAGAWVRRGLGTVQSVDGRLVWTFAAPHLGHWMAAPLSPSRGVRLELHVDFLLRHGSFLMILLGSTLTVAVCLLVGLLCCPRSPPKESKLRRPAVNPLHSVKDQSTSTGEDLSLSNGQYNVAIYDAGVIANADAELRQTRDGSVTLDYGEEKLQNEAQSLGNGLFFYNQPVAILHAPAFFQTDEDWSRSQDNVGQTKITNKEKENVKKKSELKSRAHSGLPESVSEPGTTGPRAWFVSLEGKPAAEIRYAVSEEQRRSRAAESRDTSLDSGLDLTEPGQARRDERKLERNATFLKKNISSSGSQSGAGQ